MKDELGSVMITTKTPQKYIEKLGEKCEICGHCCKFDSGIFLADDIKKVAGSLGIPPDDFKKRYLEEKKIFNRDVHKAKLKREGKPFGPCVFLDEKQCAIHDFKPVHCKIASGCNEFGQEINLWFMLNFIVDENDPQAIREWAQYLKTHPTIQGGNLHELVPDKVKLERILNYKILK